MQVAYASTMKKEESPRRIRRRERLIELIAAAGGAATVARESGTPKSHLSAMVNGTRGLGDELAGKLEVLYGRPEGWFDAQTLSPPLLQNQTQVFPPTVTTSPPPMSDYARDLAVLFDRLTTVDNRADVAEACRELIRIKAAESQSSAPNQSSRRAVG